MEFNYTWKLLIISIFIISITSLFINIKNITPIDNTYTLKIIELDNNNFSEYIWVVDYLCDEGIEVTNIQHNILWKQHYFYASAWLDAKSHKGKCVLKIKTP